MSSPSMTAGALIGACADPQDACDRIRFRRSLTLAAMTLLIPGSAQLVHGSRRLGRFALRIWLGLWAFAAVLALLAYADRSLMFTLATSGALLWAAKWGLIVLALGWAYLVFDAWRLGRPFSMSRGRLAVSTGVHALLVVAVAGVLVFAASVVSVMNGLTGTVFAATTVSHPHDGRYNVVLFGADSGQGRVGTRPDSINVVSIDADTGRAVLVGLPRNLENAPFPSGSVMAKQFPHGFDCGDSCMLNAIYTWAEQHASLFGNDKHPGITATMGAISQITGLKLNYYVMVDMAGFSKLVDALGGVRLTVRSPIAMFSAEDPVAWRSQKSRYIPVGTYKLTGNQALWYARSRVQTDDWTRMGRQKCVMNAMLHQMNPRTVLTNASAIASSGAAMVTTDIPRSDLDTFMSLALKTRSQPVASVSMVPPLIYGADPDYAKVRRLVASTIARSEGAASASTMGTTSLPTIGNGSSGATGTSSSSAATSPRKANQTSDLSTAC